MDPLITRAEMQWFTSWENLADEPSMAEMDPTMLPEQRCLKYQYTKLGQMNLLSGQWTPWGNLLVDALNTASSRNLTDEASLAYDKNVYQSRNGCGVSLHKTWQMNTRALGNGPLPLCSAKAEMPWMPVHLCTGMQSHLCSGTGGPPMARAEMTCIPVHQVWQYEPTLANGPITLP